MSEDEDEPLIAHPEELKTLILTHIEGLSLGEASERMGANPGYLSNLLSGGQNLTPAMARRFARTFNADYDALMALCYAYNVPHPELLGYRPEQFRDHYLQKALRAVQDILARQAYVTHNPPELVEQVTVQFEGRQPYELALPKKLADLSGEEFQRFLQSAVVDLTAPRTPPPPRTKKRPRKKQ